MTQIKSALEIAMERTEDVKGDRETLLIHNLKNEGMKMTSEALNYPEKIEELKKRIESLSVKEKGYFMEGVSSTITSNLSLPSGDEYKDSLKNLQNVFLPVCGNKKQVKYIFEQIDGFFAQFIQNRAKLEENLTAQYEPRLRQKEDELFKKMGAKVHLEPLQDPEFVSILHDNLRKLEERYGEALGQAKGELTHLLGIG